MQVLITCPNCNHRQRVEQNRIGGAVTCLACGRLFEARPGRNGQQKSGTSGEAKPAANSSAERWIQRWWGSSAALLDGIIPGVLSGMVSGFLLGLFYIHPDPVTGDPVGGSLNRGLLGVGLGFPLGIVLGAVVTAIGGMMVGKEKVTRRSAALLTGVILGPTLALLVADYSWCLWGAGFATGVAIIWPLLCSKMEAAMEGPPTKKTLADYQSSVEPRDKGRRSDGRYELLGDFENDPEAKQWERASKRQRPQRPTNEFD